MLLLIISVTSRSFRADFPEIKFSVNEIAYPGEKRRLVVMMMMMMIFVKRV